MDPDIDYHLIRMNSALDKSLSPPSQLEEAIGPEVLNTLSKQTGLSREELLARLCRELPDVIKYTPQGRLPAEADFSGSPV